MTLDNLEILNGILMIILCSISIYVGIKIILTYKKNREKVYIFVGLFWIFLVCPWYPGTISFILVLLEQKSLTPEAYFIIGNVFIPIAILCWVYSFTELMYKDYQKFFVVFYMILGIIAYMLFFTALIIDPKLIGELQGEIDVQYSNYVVIFYVIILATILITGVLFAYASLKLDNPELQLRGKFLFLANISYVIGGIIDALIPQDLFILILQRSFQIFSVFCFYLAYLLPHWIKRLFLK